MRRIAMINQKGGVGKTTTTVNVGVALARAGHRVLLMDLDPQAHLTLHLGHDPTGGRPGTYELLTGSATVSKARDRIAPNLWLVASGIDLAGAEVELASVVGREVILRDLLNQHVGAGANGRTLPYDYVLMDCPPSLGVLTLNGLCAAEEVFIPLQPHYLALQGLSKLLETVSLVSKRINPALTVGGVMLCMHETGTRLAGEVVADVRSFFASARNTGVPWADARVFDSVIRRNIKLAEAPSYGQSVFDYAPDSNGARDYEQLAREIAGAAGVDSAPPTKGHGEEVGGNPRRSLKSDPPSETQQQAGPTSETRKDSASDENGKEESPAEPPTAQEAKRLTITDRIDAPAERAESPATPRTSDRPASPVPARPSSQVHEPAVSRSA